jgi:hypothetical protein
MFPVSTAFAITGGLPPPSAPTPTYPANFIFITPTKPLDNRNSRTLCRERHGDEDYDQPPVELLFAGVGALFEFLEACEPVIHGRPSSTAWMMGQELCARSAGEAAPDARRSVTHAQRPSNRFAAWRV